MQGDLKPMDYESDSDEEVEEDNETVAAQNQRFCLNCKLSRNFVHTLELLELY